MGNRVLKTSVAVALILEPIMALAGTVDAAIPVSEPETLALVAIGAVAVIVARWTKRK